jgi:hypothetical protein
MSLLPHFKTDIILNMLILNRVDMFGSTFVYKINSRKFIEILFDLPYSIWLCSICISSCMIILRIFHDKDNIDCRSIYRHKQINNITYFISLFTIILCELNKVCSVEQMSLNFDPNGLRVEMAVEMTWESKVVLFMSKFTVPLCWNG